MTRRDLKPDLITFEMKNDLTGGADAPKNKLACKEFTKEAAPGGDRGLAIYSSGCVKRMELVKE